MLTLVFTQCPGFVEVRVPPGERGVAFIEFRDEVQAGMAHKQLDGFHISDAYDLNLLFGAGVSS